MFFFFNDTATTEIYTLSLHDALPIWNLATAYYNLGQRSRAFEELHRAIEYEPNYVPGYLTMAAWYAEHGDTAESQRYEALALDRKSTRLNSSHDQISYAVFCLKKKKK